jgi:hypothetical protein
MDYWGRATVMRFPPEALLIHHGEKSSEALLPVCRWLLSDHPLAPVTTRKTRQPARQPEMIESLT